MTYSISICHQNLLMKEVGFQLYILNAAKVWLQKKEKELISHLAN